MNSPANNIPGYKRIIRLGLPILVGQLGMIAVGFADTIMVGQYSTVSLASAAFVNNLFNLAIFGLLGFAYGLTPLVGALFSGNHHRRIGALVRNGVAINIAVALLITLIMGVVYINLNSLGQPEELLPVIRPYYLIYLAGLVPVALFNVLAQWSYGIRNTAMPMWITLGSNLVNVFGNWLLIYGHFGCPEMGLTGAGISTLVSRVLCCLAIICVFLFNRRYREYREGFVKSRLDSGSCGVVARTSWPVALQMMFETGAFSGSAVMAGWLGSISLAAFQVIVTISTLGFCIYYSMASAVSVLVANSAGLNDGKAMRTIAFRGYRVILCLAAISSLVFIFGLKGMVWLFTDDPVVATSAIALLVPLLAYQLGDATQINFVNALRGTANVMPLLWIAFVCYILVGLPATYLFAFTFGMGLKGIVFSFSVSLFLAGALFFLYFMRTTRRYISTVS